MYKNTESQYEEGFLKEANMDLSRDTISFLSLKRVEGVFEKIFKEHGVPDKDWPLSLSSEMMMIMMVVGTVCWCTLNARHYEGQLTHIILINHNSQSMRSVIPLLQLLFLLILK